MDYGDAMLRQMSDALGRDVRDEISDEAQESLGESLRLLAESVGHLHLGDTCSLNPPCRESRKARLRVV